MSLQRRGIIVGAEKLVKCNRDIWSPTLRFFEKEIQDRRFFIVLFLHYKTRWGTLGNFSKVAIDFVTSSAGGRMCRVSQRLVITVTTLVRPSAKATRQPIAGRKSLEETQPITQLIRRTHSKLWCDR